MLLTLALGAVLIGLDQLCKLFASTQLGPGGAVSFVPGLIEFRYVENDGAAFSLLAGKQTFLIVVTGLALLAVAYILLFRQKRWRLDWWAFLLIFAGGVGNLIDRVANGYVVDYINLLFMRFAVFNLADCFVCIGFALLVVAYIRAELAARREKKQQGQQDAATDAAQTGQKTSGAPAENAKVEDDKNLPELERRDGAH